jgi:hypothetical protein
VVLEKSQEGKTTEIDESGAYRFGHYLLARTRNDLTHVPVERVDEDRIVRRDRVNQLSRGPQRVAVQSSGSQFPFNIHLPLGSFAAKLRMRSRNSSGVCASRIGSRSVNRLTHLKRVY